MLFVVAIPLLTQLVIPLGLIAWLAFGRPRSRASRVLTAVLTAVFIVAIGVAGLWLVLPWFMPFAYAALLVIALVGSRGRAADLPPGPQGWRQVAVLVSLGAGVALTGSIAVHGVASRRAPGNAVRLAFPLRGGTYLVVNGGGSKLLNAHFATLNGDRSRAYRGQSYGVDLVRIDRLGLRARGLLPRDPGAYTIFGDQVFAPCAGRVVNAEDGHRDLPPPTIDRRHLAGNHVLLDCEPAWVLLAHLRRGSLRVVTGQRVETGRALGRVGNTGNTGEPHLHIHAQRPGTTEAPLSGEPLPVRFGGWYPARNTRLTAREATP